MDKRFVSKHNVANKEIEKRKSEIEQLKIENVKLRKELKEKEFVIRVILKETKSNNDENAWNKVTSRATIKKSNQQMSGMLIVLNYWK